MEYSLGEILTRRKAGRNGQRFLLRVMDIGGVLNSKVSIMLPLLPTTINRIQLISLYELFSQSKPSSLTTPVITNKPDKTTLKSKTLLKTSTTNK